jgi:hypothetical protein
MQQQVSARHAGHTRQHECRSVPHRVHLTRRRRVSMPARAHFAHSLPAPLPLPRARHPATPTTPASPSSSSLAPTTTTTTTAAAAAQLAPTTRESVDILFAGYSDIAERLQAAHARIEQLEQRQQGAAAAAADAAAGALPFPPSSSSPFSRQSPWDAAVFLLFFLGFINVAGWIALWQAQAAIGAATQAPWWLSIAPPLAPLTAAGRAAAAAPASAPLFAVLLKRLVLFFVPLTNTAVVLTFCAAAVKAALACLRAWE